MTTPLQDLIRGIRERLGRWPSYVGHPAIHAGREDLKKTLDLLEVLSNALDDIYVNDTSASDKAANALDKANRIVIQ